MKLNQIAVQLYTLRDFCKTPADLAVTAKKVRAIGFQNVELGGLGPMSDDEIINILKEADLHCCSLHESVEAIISTPEKVLERLRHVGCQYAVCSYPSGVDMKSEASVIQFAEKMERSAKVLSQGGKTLCHHNHALEFSKSRDKTMMELLFLDSHTKLLNSELDTYWVQCGGADPIEWCKHLKGRLPLLHMKDYGVSAETHQPIFSEIGYGNLNFKAIIAAAEFSGCEWFIVEQDTCPGDPFDSIKKSFDYLKAHLIAS